MSVVSNLDASFQFDPGRSDHILRFVTSHVAHNKVWLALLYWIVSVGGTLLVAYATGGDSSLEPILADRASLVGFVLLLPVGIFLVLRLYEQMRMGFVQLVADRVIEFESEAEGQAFLRDLDRRLNAPWAFWVALGLALGGNVAWLIVLPPGDWKRLDSGAAAWWMRPFVIANIYVIIMTLLKSLIAVRSMRLVFDRRVALQPLHPDRCGGLRSLGNISMALNYFLGLVAVFIWLKAFLSDALLTPWFLALMIGFAIVAVYIFAAPLARAHDRMFLEKQKILSALNKDFQRTYQEVARGLEGNSGLPLEGAQKLQALEHLHQVASRMPVWPYDVRIIAQLVGAIIVPPLTGFAVEFVNAYLVTLR